MLTHQVNSFDGGSQGFAHAVERHRTSYPTNMLSLSTQSPVQQLGRMYSGNPPNGYHGSPGHNGQSYEQVGGPDEEYRLVRREFQEYRDESHTPLGNKRPFSPLAESYTIGTLTVSSPHSCNLLNAVLENASHHVPALQFSNSEGTPAQFGQLVYEGRSADRAVPNNIQGIYNDISLPLSSPGRNSGLESLEIQGISL